MIRERATNLLQPRWECVQRRRAGRQVLPHNKWGCAHTAHRTPRTAHRTHQCIRTTPCTGSRPSARNSPSPGFPLWASRSTESNSRPRPHCNVRTARSSPSSTPGAGCQAMLLRSDLRCTQGSLRLAAATRPTLQGMGTCRRFLQERW